MRTVLRPLVLFSLIGIALSSCRVFDPSIMLRTKHDYAFDLATDSLPANYIIQKGDLINFRLFSNQGFKIIDLTSLDDGTRTNMNLNQQNSFIYLIEADSSINLPIIGRVKIAGMNLKEAELFLEDKYSNYYNDPFVMLRVNNRRIMVFPGESGQARIIQIENEYTTIIEALAMAGGISPGGKAHRVKVVRGNLKEPQVYELDLSTVEGLREANLYYVRANDIIYVQPSYFAGRQILQTTSTILSLISSSIITYLLIVQFTSAN